MSTALSTDIAVEAERRSNSQGDQAERQGSEYQHTDDTQDQSCVQRGPAVRRATRVIPASVAIAYGRGCRDFGGQRHAKGCAVRSLHAQPACSLASARPIPGLIRITDSTPNAPYLATDSTPKPPSPPNIVANSSAKNATGISTEKTSAVGSLTIAKELRL